MWYALQLCVGDKDTYVSGFISLFKTRVDMGWEHGNSLYSHEMWGEGGDMCFVFSMDCHYLVSSFFLSVLSFFLSRSIYVNK